jgi:hypothetical protein
MNIANDIVLKAKILEHLARQRKWQHSHTAIENLEKGFPKHLRGRIKDIVHELIKEGLILLKHTNYGVQVSLNFEKKEEIYRHIERLNSG